MFSGAARGRGWSRSRSARRTTTGTCSWTRTLGTMRRLRSYASSESLPYHLMYHHHFLRQNSSSKPCPRPRLLRPGSPARHGQLPLSAASSPSLPLTLSSSSLSSCVPPQVVPYLVLQVPSAGMHLPDDVPCFERLCSRTVGQPIKDMIREKLDQEEEFNDDLDLDLDLDVDDEDSIIAWIQIPLVPQDFLGENDEPRITNRETAPSGPSTIASSRSSSATLSTVYRNHGRRRPIRAHKEAW
ncbi:hypothetical protein EDB87DRAFT_1306238 [Lactarius vividus]|nr:hypothetical protein EDB87DRAFT_1306238 [Lactarius vividus]